MEVSEGVMAARSIRQAMMMLVVIVTVEMVV